MNNNKIIFSLNVEDIQNVALEEIGRELTDKEMNHIAEHIPDYIQAHEAIAHCIAEQIKSDPIF